MATVYPRVATRRGFCWEWPPARACPRPDRDCAISKPTAVASKFIPAGPKKRPPLFRGGLVRSYECVSQFLPMGQMDWLRRASRSRSRICCSQCSPTSSVGCSFVPSRLIPEREFDPVPESEFVVDDAQVVLDDMFGGPDAFCDFPILESLSNEFDNKLFSFTGDTLSVALASEHSCLRYK